MLFNRRLGYLVCSLVFSLACQADDEGNDDGQAGMLDHPCLGGGFCNEGLICSAGTCVPDPNTDDTGPEPIGLYEGPCEVSEDCAGDAWCTETYVFCTIDCMEDEDCPAHPDSTGVPRCTGLYREVGGLSPRWGCALECEQTSLCPSGAQCWALGTSSFCGY